MLPSDLQQLLLTAEADAFLLGVELEGLAWLAVLLKREVQQWAGQEVQEELEGQGRPVSASASEEVVQPESPFFPLLLTPQA